MSGRGGVGPSSSSASEPPPGRSGLVIWGREGEIHNVEQWLAGAPPKGGKKHWVSGRSAMELARAWCGTNGIHVPTELEDLLASRPETRDLRLVEGWPERRVRFDDSRREPRNTDLALIGVDPNGHRLAVSVEAKADEVFDGRVRGRLGAAERRVERGERSNFPARLTLLREALFGPDSVDDDRFLELRYQLLAGTAGALAFASEMGAELALLVIHEFLPPEGSPKAEGNARDLDSFMEALTRGQVPKVEYGTLYGPFSLPGGGRIPTDVPLLVGKVLRTIPGL